MTIITPGIKTTDSRTTCAQFWNMLSNEVKSRVLLDIGETAIPYAPENLRFEALTTRVQKLLCERYGYNS